MSTSVTFEVGVISDALKKAARFAPNKVGPVFSKASGIILDIAPGTDSPCVIRATDTEVFYIEALSATATEGDAVRWRLPSQLMANTVGTIPPTQGKTVTFTQTEKSNIQISSGRLKIKVILNPNPDYPEWDISPAEDLTLAPSFGTSLSRVEWACGRDGPTPIDGVHIDGDYLLATDRYRIVKVPCKLEVDEPVTIHGSILSQVLRNTGDVKIGVDGNFFVIMPDEYTQIKAVILGAPFPALGRIIDEPHEVQVAMPRAPLIEMINAATQFAGSDRAPIVKLIVGREEIAVFMNNDEVGMFGNVIEVPGQATHDRVTIAFTPKMILDCLSNAPGEVISFGYTPNNLRRPVSVEVDGAYSAWSAPRTVAVSGP